MFKSKVVTLILAALMAIGICSTAANADSTTPESAYVHSKVTSVAFKVVKQKGWIGVQEHIKIQHVPKSKCGWYKWFWNSDYLVGETDQKPQMYKDHHGYLCPDKYSPTGWVKRGGGHTGSDCGNIAAPPFVKPKFPVVKPPIMEVNSETKLKLKLKVTVTAEATATKACGTGTATGSAYDFIEVKASTYVKAKSNEALKLKLASKASAKAKDRAEATVEIKCEGSPPPPPCSTCHEKPPCQTCHEEPPCTTCTPPCGEVEFFSEYEFEEAHVNEGPIQYWKYINAPKGHQLTVYFETEHGSFSPEFVQVASFGAETTKFQSYWTAPSHPGHYPVWIRVVDHTCGKTYESAKQFVTVLEWELSEPPR